MTDENGSIDLEDGEIESDQEAEVEPASSSKPEEAAALVVADEDVERRKKSSRKKAKEHATKTKDFRTERYPKSPPTDSVGDDDFAGNIEKAIRKVLKKRETENGGDDNDNDEDSKAGDGKRKHKRSKKKHESGDKDNHQPKRKKKDEDEEVDEDEMMFVRGASPVNRPRQHFDRDSSPARRRRTSKENNDVSDESSDGSDHYRRDKGSRSRFRGRGGSRPLRSERFKLKFDRHRSERHPLQDPDGVCLFYMQGKCYKGDDCAFSHDAQPPRKMELCKFYLMGCCAKRDKCLYLHSDFPCKYYHTGLPCFAKDNCKFAHGRPLSEDFRTILLKHIELAPKEILGDFPRLNRESAMIMMTNTQNRLESQCTSEKDEARKKSRSPSPPAEKDVKNSYKSEESVPDAREELTSREKNRKKRQSRWNNSSVAKVANPLSQSILSIQNLTGVLTGKQITDLTNLGIKDITQLSQLTVIQLNQLGINYNQINEIQLNTLNIQKLGLIDANAEPNPNMLLNKTKATQDLDMRVSPGLPPQIPTPINNQQSDNSGDVDMRFHSNSDLADKETPSDSRKNKDSLDIDQYTKDALQFKMSEVSENENKLKDLDVDHRVLNYVRDAAVTNVNLSKEDLMMKNEGDIDIRIQSRSMFHHRNEEKARRLTTDDEDDSLHIDEKWYSSDDDQPKIKSSTKSNDTKPLIINTTDTKNVIKSLGDLSKIDISEDITKLLSTMKESTSNENSSNVKKEYLKSRDPRHLPKPPSENKETPSEVKKTSHKPEFVSIYDCIEMSDTDTIRRKTDVDLRPTKDVDMWPVMDVDLRMPSYGDTDLRQTPGGSDIDLRLSLPIKHLSNYTPASEIDGSFGSHAPITYKLYAVDIPRPDYTCIKNSTPKSQAYTDPRLRKMFRLSTEEPTANVETPATKPTPASVRSDPRKRTEVPEKNAPPKPIPLELPMIIQTSEWYKELGSNHKILVNQQLASVTSTLKAFHLAKLPGAKFDLSEIKANNFLCMIFHNLGIHLDESGEFFHTTTTTNSQDNLPSGIPPGMNFNQNPDMFMGGGHVDNSNVMMMGGHMNNFDPRYQMQDQMHTSSMGMLGMPPPNMNSNFDMMAMSNYGGPDNYNMNYDGYHNDQGNNENDYMIDDMMDDDYYRETKVEYKKSFRGGRNNERWNRGRSRGNVRDRRGYTERTSYRNK